MAFIHTWSNKWRVKARNEATGTVFCFTRENHLTHFYTVIECDSWCSRNGYELIGVEEL